MKKKLSHVLISTGLVFMFYAGCLLYVRYAPNKLSFAEFSEPALSSKIENTQPVHLTIPSVGVNTSIVSSNITDGVWETSPTSVSYLSISPVPGDTGNSILYGHNWTSILGNLTKTKPGETLHVQYSDGTRKDFVVEYTSMVSPEDTEIIKQTSDSRITLYTCAGFLDSKRFVVIAKPLDTI